MLRGLRRPEAWRRGSKQWSNKSSSARDGGAWTQRQPHDDHEFTSNHKMDAIDIGKHLSRLYDRVDQLQGQIYDLQNQNYEYEYRFKSISQWEFVPTKPPKARLPNHIIGSLIRKYFPGLAKPNDDDPPSPGFIWEHNQHTKDEHGVTMVAQVVINYHMFLYEAFSCVDGEKDKATKALLKSVRKILCDVKHTLRYKVVMQCQLLDDKGEKMTRKTVCQMNLEK
ncbi:Glutamate decarboxylase 1 [Hordeum vulgare]|nr:Glutamate decarboxylase 1 [Hordeum vulgare]